MKKGARGPKGNDGICFKLTSDGNYDLDGKRLTSTSDPIDNQDSATKKYAENEIA